MKFLIDAQLPKKLVSLFQDLNQEAIYTLDLPKQNTTQDEEINELSCQYQYIVVTKDKDFLDSFILRKKPYKLLLITTGNIKNSDLINILSNNLLEIITLFENHYFIEVNQTQITIHQ
ncbi:DUF5615 family PIN-like protein [Cyanobacterium aponinum AL20118]|uniref:DUF5615 domain-containing protein n=2 Tax=Cyanobacterium aponinum TaxID=379064 RepID=A0A844GWG4_9CHRO|nr:DUF5615 family PIN-like protein [Cyanobacterium aponinum]MTF39238.1 hypothetical protein [Cyanobacterium aponinum 0216]PHV63587.1 hypothetical protein CSQ80_04450 [Cyanobacterium aponinum IPPAS B-1201]WPF88226.1 DUF5615 family PIN-like protein [Cyanobacterium aponinum AL20115]